jgi:hypothetical protein
MEFKKLKVAERLIGRKGQGCEAIGRTSYSQ